MLLEKRDNLKASDGCYFQLLVGSDDKATVSQIGSIHQETHKKALILARAPSYRGRHC